LGPNRFEIRWTRTTNRRTIENPDLFETEEPVPARYNSQSELKAKVTPGNNPLDFTLDTRAKQ
jgi:hypothetical protein